MYVWVYMYVQDLYKCVWMFDFMYLHLCQMKTTDHNNETVTSPLDTKYITTSLSQFKDG